MEVPCTGLNHFSWEPSTFAGRATPTRRPSSRWEAGTEYNWGIVNNGADRAIRAVSCCKENDAAKIGYLVNRKYWGKGYATIAAVAVVVARRLAASAIVGLPVSEPAIRRIWATCDSENAASIRVLEKIGMTRERMLERYKVRPNIGPKPRDAYLYSMKLPRSVI